MYEVTVNRTELLDAVKKNRDNHRAAFEKALDDYKTAVVLELEDWLEDARLGKKFQRRSVLIQPQDHTNDYDRVINMLEMSVQNEITLDATSFARYVRDEWEWHGQFMESTATNTSYIASKMGSPR